MIEIIIGMIVAGVTFLIATTIFVSGLIAGFILLAKYVWNEIVDAGCDSE